VSDFIEPATGVFVEDAFRHLLSREAQRATRYQDFFSVCLVKPDSAKAGEGEDVQQVMMDQILTALKPMLTAGAGDDVRLCALPLIVGAARYVTIHVPPSRI